MTDAAGAGDGSALVEVGGRVVTGRTLCAGHASGPVLALSLPLSFWGGVDHDGRIVDARHPQLGASVTGTVLTMTAGRGSSSSSSVLAELIRCGAAPCAVVLAQPDAIVALGALAAAELYAVHCPVVQVAPPSLALLRTGSLATVTARP